MKSVFVLCLLVAYFVDEGKGDLKDFLNQFPQDVAHAFSVAWSSLIDVIKNPVRSKRIGLVAKRRTTVTTTTIVTTTTDETVESDNEDATAQKLTLPFLHKPTFRSMDDWNGMQKPRFATRMPLSSTLSYMTHETPTDFDYDDQRQLTEAGYDGPLMII